MQGGLRGRIKYIALTLSSLLLVSCGVGSSSNIEMPAETVITEVDSMNTQTNGDTLVQKLCMLLDCDAETAKSDLEIIKRYTETEISDFDLREKNAYTIIIAKGDSGTDYLIYFGTAKGVRKIYRGNETGEILFRAMV